MMLLLVFGFKFVLAETSESLATSVTDAKKIAIEILKPLDGDVLKSNTVVLEFKVKGEPVGCFYKINDREEVKLSKCQKTEFELKNGEYKLTLYAFTEDQKVSEVVSFIVKSEEPIDTTSPIITVDPYITTPTNGDIVVTVHTNEGTLNATSHTFTENGSFDFIATDAAGNSTTKTITITNIDKIVPTAVVSYDITTQTTGNVVATITPSESITVTNNGGSLSHTFTDNGDFTFNFIDLAGNTGSVIATVANINRNNNTGGGGAIVTRGGGGGGLLIIPTTPIITPTPVITPAPAVGQVLGVEKFKFNNDFKFGSKLSPDVKELQNRLTTEGFFKAKANGYFGLATKAAVKAYQKANSPLEVDGIVGPKTREILNK